MSNAQSLEPLLAELTVIKFLSVLEQKRRCRLPRCIDRIFIVWYLLMLYSLMIAAVFAAGLLALAVGAVLLM